MLWRCRFARVAEIFRVLHGGPAQEEGQGTDRQIDVKDPAPGILVGDPTAQRRTEHRCNESRDAEEGLRGALLLGRKGIEQDTLAGGLEPAAGKTLHHAEEDQLIQTRRHAAKHRADGEDRDRKEEISASSEIRGEPAGDWQDDRIGSQIAGDHPLAIGDRRGKSAGNVAQSHIGDRGIQHFHEGRHHHGERDNPRVEESADSIVPPGTRGGRRDGAHGVAGLGSPDEAGWSLFLEKLAGVRTGGCSSQIHRRRDRKTDEKRRLVRIVVHHIDPHRQPLHHFDEISSRILRRQQRQSRAGAVGEAGNASLESPLAAVHVQLQFHALADPQIAELGFLEICVHPDVAQRADSHQTLTHLHVVAGVHIAPGDDAIDLRHNRAVAQIQLCLIEITLRLQQTRLGLFQIRARSGQPLRRCDRYRRRDRAGKIPR